MVGALCGRSSVLVSSYLAVPLSLLNFSDKFFH